MKKLISILLALTLIVALGSATLASSEEPEAPADRPSPEVVEGKRYVTEHVAGASAIYVSGEQMNFDDTYFYGVGNASSEYITAQVPNQFGYASVVLAVGQGTEVTLNNPTIRSDPQSYSNGVFAAGMAKVTVNGGSITTDNSSGHGVDTTYMGHVYLYDTVIHTSGGTSGGLASDFGGGFIQGERLNVTTEAGSSPAIFCAGTTIIMLKDSKLATTSATGVIVAHDHSVVALEDCKLNARGAAIGGLQALPSPESSEGSTFFSFGSTLRSETGAVLSQSGGRTVMNLIDTVCESDVDKAISCTKGILTVNLWNTELTGSIECTDGCTLVVNIYEGGKLTGEVTGDVEINVYDGGEYVGSCAVNEAGAGEDAPVPASFDDYLVAYWGIGSMTWSESRAQTFVATYEPEIIANSAASYADNSSASVAYDETYDPSENGIDLSLVGGAHGFTEAEVFGGAESRTFPASGEASGEASKEE